ncbi:MAG: ASKHA domain-containing protein [Ilumatobacteraceae bacterium]
MVFTPSGLEGKVVDGTTVLEAARQVGADLDTVCGGRGICGRCQITPSTGRFAKWHLDVATDALGPPAAIELDYHGNRPLVPGNRLGCAARIQGDVVVDVPATSQVHRQVVRKDLALPPVVVDPRFTLHFVEVPPAHLGDSTSAAGALAVAIGEQHHLATPTVAAVLLPAIHRLLAAEQGAVTAAVRRDHDNAAGTIVAAWPGYVDAAYGVAVDVGSTTIAGHLCDLGTGEVVATAGRMNPQIRFGEDLMSRVSYVMMNPGGERQLTAAVRTAVDELVGELADAAVTTRDRILEVVAVGNPIMHHLLLGIDPTPLGSAPFTLATADPVELPAAALGLDLSNASAWVGPCIAGHVGADTTAAMLAEGPHRGEAMQLLVDVGTNAEIVLGDRHRQFAASSPTGPAFEGAQISCGQRATAGAIERVRIDRTTLEPSFRVIGTDAWSDEPAFAVARPAVTGVCGSGIIDVIAEMFLAGIIDADGTIRPEPAAVTPRVVPDGRTYAYVLHDDGTTRLAITQNDVRAIQLAKAALRAGIELLLDHAGRPELTDVRLAGAFGAHIDPVHAMVLGLVPDGPVDGVRSVGNAAGAGAVHALLSRAKRTELIDAAREVTKVETATEPRFQELFVAAMALPHATIPTPQLATVVDLPARTDEPTAGRRRRRSR